MGVTNSIQIEMNSKNIFGLHYENQRFRQNMKVDHERWEIFRAKKCIFLRISQICPRITVFYQK